MAERADQPERDRRKAYAEGYKTGIDNFYNTIPRSGQQRTAWQELLMFHDHELILWSQTDVDEKVSPPKAIIKQLSS